jgi:hypothetical protein
MPPPRKRGPAPPPEAGPGLHRLVRPVSLVAQVSNRQHSNGGMAQSRVTLGRGNFCRKPLYLIGLLPKPTGQSVTLLSGRLNHAQTARLMNYKFPIRA